MISLCDVGKNGAQRYWHWFPSVEKTIRRRISFLKKATPLSSCTKTFVCWKRTYSPENERLWAWRESEVYTASLGPMWTLLDGMSFESLPLTSPLQCLHRLCWVIEDNFAENFSSFLLCQIQCLFRFLAGDPHSRRWSFTLCVTIICTNNLMLTKIFLSRSSVFVHLVCDRRKLNDLII